MPFEWLKKLGMKLGSVSKKDNILIVAAEASSCMYAELFIDEWCKKNPNFNFFGVGNKKLESMGMDCQGFAEEMAVVGLQEVIKHWPVIKGAADSILSECEKRKPRFALLLDYPGFNLRLAKKLHEMKIPVVYYISPQLWAWKKGRVKQVKKYIDDMMVVFPFEVEFYKEYRIPAHFVGHPLVEVVENELESFAPKKGNDKVLGLMPGSRKSEIANNLKIQLEAAALVKKQKPEVEIKLLLAPTLQKEDLFSIVEQSGIAVEFLQGKPTQMIHQCDWILSASGTATLQVALCEKPMVVMYRMNPITAFLAKLLVRSVDSFCIVNLVAGRKVVPELFQEQASPQNLANHLLDFILNSSKKEKMVADLQEVKIRLGKGGATENLVNFLNKKYGAK